MVYDLDLLLYYGDFFRKIIMFSHLPRELFDLRVRDRLRDPELFFCAAVAGDVGDDHADKREPAGDDRDKNLLHLTPLADDRKRRANAGGGGSVVVDRITVAVGTGESESGNNVSQPPVITVANTARLVLE